MRTETRIRGGPAGTRLHVGSGGHPLARGYSFPHRSPARAQAAALRAASAIWSHRSRHNLLGAHIDLRTGAWTQADAGVGRGIDSFYEYMLKAHMLLGGDEYLAMFHDSYAATAMHLRRGPWYVDTHVVSAQVREGGGLPFFCWGGWEFLWPLTPSLPPPSPMPR